MTVNVMSSAKTLQTIINLRFYIDVHKFSFSIMSYSVFFLFSRFCEVPEILEDFVSTGWVERSPYPPKI